MTPSLFGAPVQFTTEQRDRWTHQLEVLWRALAGAAPGALSEDLPTLLKYFGTGVKIRALRDVTEQLPDFAAFADLPVETVLQADGAAVITPEGRILLDLLLECRRSDVGSLTQEQRMDATETARLFRSQSHRTWLEKQFDPKLSPTALGAAMYLLVNRSIGVEAALLLPRDDDMSREIADAVLPSIRAFNDALHGRPVADDGIREHWAFSQVSRFLTRYVRREVPKGADGSIYIRAGKEKALLDYLAAYLEDSDQTARAFAVGEFIETYRETRGKLSTWGLDHDDPAWTRKVGRTLVGAEHHG